MSENYIDYAQKLREQARVLLNIAEQLEQQARPSPKATSKPPSTGDRFANLNVQEVARLKTSQILLSRNKYQTCHIWVSDGQERFPAIVVDGDYYSLVRVFPDIKQVLAAKAKLEWNGDRTVITQIATGYALWVWEPDAQRDLPSEEDPVAIERSHSIPDLHLVPVSDSQTSAQVSLTEYLLVFNRLSEWANCYLGTAVVVHYWKCTRPELPWLEQFEVVGSGQIICRHVSPWSLNIWQEKQLQLWLQRFIQRCRRTICDFPQPFLAEYKSNQLLAHLLDEHLKGKD